MKIFWIGFAMVLPALAQAPDAAAQRALVQAADKLQQAVIKMQQDTRVVAVRGGIVKSAPYSADAVTETTQLLADGNRIEQSTTQKLYRDSEGRERREETVLATGALAQAQMPHMLTISDPVADVSYTLDTEQRTARRVSGFGTGIATGVAKLNVPVQFYGTVVGARIRQYDATIGNGSTVAKEDLGSRNIEGVTAQGKRTTETIPAGQIGNVAPINIVDEVWYSPELKMNVLTTHSDPRSGETVYKLTNINRAEQPKSLFEPPADYTVTGPAAGGRGRGAPVFQPSHVIEKAPLIEK